MAFKMVAFSLSGLLVHFKDADNAWDLIRRIYQTHNFWKDYADGKIGRMAARTEEYKEWKIKGIKRDKLMIDMRKNMKVGVGVAEVFSELNSKKIATAIISDNPDLVVEDVAHQLGAKYFACNKILFTKEGLAYDTIPSHPSADLRVSKILALRDFANKEGIKLAETAFIGNDKEDIQLFRFVGRSIAFNARDHETIKAAQIRVNSSTLQDVLEYLK